MLQLKLSKITFVGTEEFKIYGLYVPIKHG